MSPLMQQEREGLVAPSRFRRQNPRTLFADNITASTRTACQAISGCVYRAVDLSCFRCTSTISLPTAGSGISSTNDGQSLFFVVAKDSSQKNLMTMTVRCGSSSSNRSCLSPLIFVFPFHTVGPPRAQESMGMALVAKVQRSC